MDEQLDPTHVQNVLEHVCSQTSKTLSTTIMHCFFVPLNYDVSAAGRAVYRKHRIHQDTSGTKEGKAGRRCTHMGTKRRQYVRASVLYPQESKANGSQLRQPRPRTRRQPRADADADARAYTRTPYNTRRIRPGKTPSASRVVCRVCNHRWSACSRSKSKAKPPSPSRDIYYARARARTRGRGQS